MSQNENTVVAINNEINKELTKETAATLLATTFKGLDVANMKKALLEGLIRGFTFQDFLKKNVYAIKFGDGYSLVTSIDNSRKIGMKNGIVGTDAPVYTMRQDDATKIESCSVTVKRKVDEYVGDFTATVYFDEYYKPGKTWNGKYIPSMWDQKPRTMIAKVAEMHALRKACPEELSQQYIEDEIHDDQPSRMKEAETIVEGSGLQMKNFKVDENSTTKDANETDQVARTGGDEPKAGEGQ